MRRTVENMDEPMISQRVILNCVAIQQQVHQEGVFQGRTDPSVFTEGALLLMPYLPAYEYLFTDEGRAVYSRHSIRLRADAVRKRYAESQASYLQLSAIHQRLAHDPVVDQLLCFVGSGRQDVVLAYLVWLLHGVEESFHRIDPPFFQERDWQRIQRLLRMSIQRINIFLSWMSTGQLAQNLFEKSRIGDSSVLWEVVREVDNWLTEYHTRAVTSQEDANLQTRLTQLFCYILYLYSLFLRQAISNELMVGLDPTPQESIQVFVSLIRARLSQVQDILLAHGAVCETEPTVTFSLGYSQIYQLYRWFPYEIFRHIRPEELQPPQGEKWVPFDQLYSIDVATYNWSTQLLSWMVFAFSGCGERTIDTLLLDEGKPWDEPRVVDPPRTIFSFLKETTTK